MTSLPQFLEDYISLGLCIIPMSTRAKVPLVKWRQYQQRQPTREEYARWVREFPGCNWLVICGSVSGYLFVVDFDDSRSYHLFLDADRIEQQTVVVKTGREGRGYHVWGISDGIVRSFTVGREPNKLLELHGEGSLAAVPPSRHPKTGVAYEFASSVRTIQLFKDVAGSVWRRAEELGWPRRVSAYESSRTFGPIRSYRGRERRLSEKSKDRITRSFVPAWTRGRRNYLTMYLLGTFRKRGICEGDAYEIVASICDAAGDEEKTQRLSQVSYHYRKAPEDLPRLKGLAGLKEVLG